MQNDTLNFKIWTFNGTAEAERRIYFEYTETDDETYVYPVFPGVIEGADDIDECVKYTLSDHLNVPISSLRLIWR